MATEQMAPRSDASITAQSSHPDMIRIAGGAFRMGSDKHYPEEAPVHRVAVDDFWIDRAPVTNRKFFVRSQNSTARDTR
jgi:formylglycine-generating enzyme